MTLYKPTTIAKYIQIYCDFNTFHKGCLNQRHVPKRCQIIKILFRRLLLTYFFEMHKKTDLKLIQADPKLIQADLKFPDRTVLFQTA